MLNLLEISLFVEKKFIRFFFVNFHKKIRSQKTCRKKGKCTKITVSAGANLQFVPNRYKRHRLQIRASEGKMTDILLLKQHRSRIIVQKRDASIASLHIL